MAKSKNGGSRAFIRGRLGSDVYSVGKNGKGERQQVVRSLAEQVSNPRTTAQMQGRMIMSTVMQAVSALSPIIDHSFDGVATGQPSISEFIRINYGLIKADVSAHPASGYNFALNEYQEKGVKPGLFQVSDGSVAVPAAVSAQSGVLVISLPSDNITVGGLRNALGFSNEGYLTFVGINSELGAIFFRVKVSTDLSSDTVITAENVASLFSFEGNRGVSVSLSEEDIMIKLEGQVSTPAYGVIVSDKENGVWKHSKTVLSGAAGSGAAADDVLPTYPVGTDMFLNGGDL